MKKKTGASMGVKDPDTMYMPIKDDMKRGGSMYKNYGASKFGNMLNRKPKSEEERLQAQQNRGKLVDFASKNPDVVKKGISLIGKVVGGSMYDKMGASSFAEQPFISKVKGMVKGAIARGKDDSKIEATKLGGGSMYDKMGPSKYSKPKTGSSMNAYQDKEASMDDYSHEKKLKADGRYEAAKGKMSNARNDFDHAHALKKDASYDAKGRNSVMKHMTKI
jgi:hypothetical protein